MIWSDIVTFGIVASLLVMSPGPNGVLIAKIVPTSGRMAGFANVAGFVAAFYVHGALSVLGILRPPLPWSNIWVRRICAGSGSKR
jgi:threonine/homoserine/homoserine lactone efflux protein